MLEIYIFSLNFYCYYWSNNCLLGTCTNIQKTFLYSEEAHCMNNLGGWHQIQDLLYLHVVHRKSKSTSKSTVLHRHPIRWGFRCLGALRLFSKSIGFTRTSCNPVFFDLMATLNPAGWRCFSSYWMCAKNYSLSIQKGYFPPLPLIHFKKVLAKLCH